MSISYSQSLCQDTSVCTDMCTPLHVYTSAVHRQKSEVPLRRDRKDRCQGLHGFTQSSHGLFDSITCPVGCWNNWSCWYSVSELHK